MIAESKRVRATRHVTEGRQVVARQRELVAIQKKAGQETFVSEGLLAQFERTLAIFEEDLRAIELADNKMIPKRLEP